jgi:hypothetical protein
MVTKIWAALRVAAGCTPARFGAVERQGGREGGSRRERRMLLGGVVLSKSRGTAYIGSRDGNAMGRAWWRRRRFWRVRRHGSVSGGLLSSRGARGRRERARGGLGRRRSSTHWRVQSVSGGLWARRGTTRSQRCRVPLLPGPVLACPVGPGSAGRQGWHG